MHLCMRRRTAQDRNDKDRIFFSLCHLLFPFMLVNEL